MAWFAALSIGRKIAVVAAGIGLLILAGFLLVTALNRRDDAMRNAGRAEVQARWDQETAARAKVKAEFTASLGEALRPQFDTLAARIGAIDTTAARVNVQLPAAVAAAPRYRDPNCALTGPVLDQVNAARALSAEARP